MEFLFKKTNELSYEEKQQICSLFEEVFKQKTSIELFEREFLKTIKGYSYHGLMIDNDKIIGAYSAIPVNYNYFGKEYTFALSVDTMIHSNYRGNPYNLKQMANLVYDELKNDGIPFVFGAPNQKVYLVRKKILDWKDIATLDYYILPVNFSFINKNLNFANILVRIFVFLLNKISLIFRKIYSENVLSENIEVCYNLEFQKWRCFDEKLKKIDLKEGFCYYKIKDYKNLKAAYIIDIKPFNKKNIEMFTEKIYEAEKNNIDIIIYTGKLDFIPVNLFKVPLKLNPRPYEVSGLVLIDDKIDNRVFDVGNWQLNMINFDF